MLTALQRDLIDLITALPEAGPFGLAGGAALIARGVVDRLTEDLDYFTVDPGAVSQLADAITRVAKDAGLDVRTIQSGGAFVRLEIQRGSETCQVDLAQDVRIRPLETTGVGPVLALEELAADKVLAVFGRAEARDFVDLHALRARFGWSRLLAFAAEKDTGFDLDHFLAALGAFDRLETSEFPLGEDGYRALRDDVRAWRDELSSADDE